MKRPHLLSALAPAALCLTALSAMALGGCKSEPKTPAPMKPHMISWGSPSYHQKNVLKKSGNGW